MKQENSAGVIVFYIDKEPKFLLLKSNYWGFPKGWMEENENPQQTAIREVKEETNLDIKLIPNFQETQEWFYKSYDSNEIIKKKCLFFLGEITQKQAEKTKISDEHMDFKFVTLKESKNYIKIKNNKQMLTRAEKFIKNLKKQKTLF